MSTNPAMIIPEIVSQHFEEASFLWLLRDRAVSAPHYSLKDLSKLDDRVDAHIDGLRITGDEGWTICKEALTWKEVGEIFTASIIAFESGYEDRIQEVLKAGEPKPELARGIISALGWLEYSISQNHIQKLLESESPTLRRIGIAASALHRHDPGQYLDDAISSTDPLLKARALRAVGEIGGRDDKMRLYRLQENFSGAVAEVRFCAAWSAAFLGDAGAVNILKPFVEPASPFREKALNAAMRRMDHATALAWQKDLAKVPDTMRLAIIGANIIGDPVLVPWLLEQMPNPALARVAGEAFTMITGIDIALEDLEGEWPEGFEAGPNEDPEDDNVETDPDEDLPWPNVELIAAWWNKNKGQLQNGKRYLTGKPLSAENLMSILKTGLQRQRAAAALELAILNPGHPLFEVRAPAWRQKRIL